MQNRLSIFYKKILYWKLIVNFPRKILPRIETIILSFSIRDLEVFEDVVLPKILLYLETITSQKAFVKNSYIASVKSKRATINFSAKLTIRGNKSSIFFDFMNLFFIPSLRKKFLKINKKIDVFGNLCIVIKDLSIFPGLAEEGINFKYPLKIDFILKNTDTHISQFFFRELGLKL